LRVGAGLAVAALVCLGSAPLRAQEGTIPLYATVDSVAVRYFTPDTGGAAHPLFITQRQLSFEARLFALEEDPQGMVQARHARSAIDAHIVEEMVDALPNEQSLNATLLAQAIALLREGLEERVGGRDAIERAMKQDGIDAHEVEAMLTRQGRAALYLDKIAGPILSATEDDLRETYRTTSHPYRARRFEECREDLARWLVDERFRAAEQAYLQSARARMTIIYR
jgi:hypothetical protein